MPISFPRALGVWAILPLLAVVPRVGAQRPAAARDSAELARQARLIARLDSQLTTLRREVRRRPADSARTARENGLPPVTGLAGIRAGGLLQVWYAQGDGGFQNTFRIRRAELKLAGDVSNSARWAITIDPARLLSTTSTTADVNGTSFVTGTTVNQSSRILVDAYLALALPAGLELSAGQLKIPVGLEGGIQSPAALETAERALYTSDRARGGIYGDSRDVGLLLRGPANRDVDYAVGYFNGVGESQNDTDHNRAKALVGRVAARMPFLRELSLGASGALGTRSAPDSVIRQRAGAEARLVAGPVLVKTEFMSGRDGDRRGAGWYAHVGYSPTTRLNLIVRQDVFDPDLDAESTVLDARERDWVAGFTYDVPAFNVRFQMNYLRKLLSPSIAPGRNLLLTNLQAAW
jgi:hypothetical protein